MCKYKVGDVVRVILEPSEKNSKHFLTGYPEDIPLKLGQTYKIIDINQWKDGEYYFTLVCVDEYGRARYWNVLESAIALPFTVEEELD